MNQSIEIKILNKIYGHGRGWSFSQRDFSLVASRSSVDKALTRLEKKGTIRRVIRGVYDYPRYSELLQQELSPDIAKVADAISRKFGWRTQPNGPAALNLLGLSTQVPGKYVYYSNGPDRTYNIGKNKLIFRKTPTKESHFKHNESAIVVQALKSLGKERITPDDIAAMRKWLTPHLRSKVLNDTQTVTGWVYEIIREICREEMDG